MDVSRIRKLFPVTGKWNYLNHAVVSPLPTPVKEAMNSFYDQRELDGGLSYTEWFEEVEESREVIGRLIGSQGRQIAFFQSTSHALNSVTNALPLKRGDEIVVSDLEFPSNALPWVRLRERGIHINWARSRNGVLGPDDVERVISDKTRVIAISHVCYYNGFKVDLEPISEMAKTQGISLVVDAMQSLGALKIDAKKLNLDFLAANSYKWLLGPFGVALLHCRDDWIPKLRTSSVGWYSVRDIWSRRIEKFELSDTARRLELGHPNFSGIRGLRTSVELLLKMDPDVVERRVLGFTDKIREGLSRYEKVEVLSPREGVSGITLFRIYGKDSAHIVQSLRGKGIVVFSQRWKDGVGVKVSPHFYNTDEEVDAFIESVGSLAT